MEENFIEDIFERHGVRPTAVRVLIYKAASTHGDTFSLSDLEEELDTVDKSTLFRTLTLFAAHHLLHEVDDGSGSKKYCVCHNMHPCTIAERHVHFYCERCRKTYCLDSITIPPVSLPAGYRPQEAEYVIKGICAKCARP